MAGKTLVNTQTYVDTLSVTLRQRNVQYCSGLRTSLNKNNLGGADICTHSALNTNYIGHRGTVNLSAQQFHRSSELFHIL